MFRASVASAVALVAALTPVSAGGQSATDLPGAIFNRIRRVPVETRISYTVNAAIRPLPLIWIGRDNIGSGEFVSRRGPDGALALELTAGTDPSRAPRRINRWGYLGEEVRADGGSLVGLIKQSDEQSLGDITASLRQEAAHRFPFRVYAGDVSAGRARLGGIDYIAAQDFTQRGFDQLFGQLANAPIALTGTTLKPGTRTGLLSTIAELLRDSVAAWRAKTPDPIKGRRVPYFFNNMAYELVIASTDYRRSSTIGGRRYDDVLHAGLEASQPGTSKRMAVDLWYTASGPQAAVPLRVTVQPRWWFRFELTIAPPVSRGP
jgi:hypothetical protein